jgi:periplasmic protein CpxP/Spy
MKKLIVTVFALFTASLMLSAQEKAKHKRAHKQHAIAQLNLTAEQKEKAKTYRKEFKEKMGVVEKNDQVTVKEYRAKKEALKREQKAKINGLLTAEQQNQLAVMKQKKMDEKNAKWQKKMNKLSTKLNLTPDQANNLKQQHEAAKQKMMALKQNDNYTHQQKKEMMKELKKKNKESFMAGLTETQKKQLEELKKNRKQKRMMAK